LRLAEIKNGFFGFLAQVFDSWAEFLRLRIEARTKNQAAPKDPFVSAPPDHWLEMTAGLSFTDWGTKESEEGAEGEAPALPVLSVPAEIAAELESASAADPGASQLEAPPATGSGSTAQSSSFIDKRVATPEEAEFVRRQIRPAESAGGESRFLSFSGKRGGTETGAKFVPAQKLAERIPARFFEITPSAGTQGERSVPGVQAPSRVKATETKAEIKAETRAGTRSGIAGSGFVRVAANNEGALRKAAVVTSKAGPDAKSAFIGKENTSPRVAAEFPKPGIAAAIPAVFPAPHTASVPGAIAFNKAEISRPKVSDGQAFPNSSSRSFSGHPADFPQKVVSPEAGASENVFFPVAARKEPVSVFPPGKRDAALSQTTGNNSPAPPSKWASLPELDLNNSTGAPGSENLRRRHLAQLESEQKGERWSV
jgi:hypothetical protein